MPAAAVIPAPIGYIKVVAVEKLVVVFVVGRSQGSCGERESVYPALAACHFVDKSKACARLHCSSRARLHSVTESKLECSKQAL